MAYPQPSSNAYAVKGYEYFRLNTLLASAGDIYESDQSGLGFAIGPDSDISNVSVNYFDDQVTNFINQIDVTGRRSFVGRVDSNPRSSYTPANRPARVLIAPNELWNPLFFPIVQGFTRATSTQILEIPRLDVVQYFGQQPSGVVPQRNDKEWFYSLINTPSVANGYALVTIPYYGRRYAKIMFMNPVLANAFDVLLYGVDLRQQIADGSSDPGDTGEFTPLLPATGWTGFNPGVQIIVDSGATPAAPNTSIVTTGGMFDLLMFAARKTGGAGGAQPFGLKIITSDIPGGR